MGRKRLNPQMPIVVHVYAVCLNINGAGDGHHRGDQSRGQFSFDEVAAKPSRRSVISVKVVAFCAEFQLRVLGENFVKLEKIPVVRLCDCELERPEETIMENDVILEDKRHWCIALNKHLPDPQVGMVTPDLAFHHVATRVALKRSNIDLRDEGLPLCRTINR